MTTTPRKKDNLLGICHAVGEDFGFNPFWLRLVLAAGIIWQPVIVLSIYAGLGVCVIPSRLLVRRKPSVAASATVFVMPQREELPELLEAA